MKKTLIFGFILASVITYNTEAKTMDCTLPRGCKIMNISSITQTTFYNNYLENDINILCQMQNGDIKLYIVNRKDHTVDYDVINFKRSDNDELICK